MIKYILIGGNSYSGTNDGRALRDEMAKGIDHRPVKVLDCLFARTMDKWDEKFKDDMEFFLRSGDFELELASPEKFIEQVKNSDVIFFKGGAPCQLMSVLETTRDWFKELDGKVLVGSSGGADTICKYYGVGKTGNIGEGLGLLPVKIIPHWKSESNYGEGLSIDWDGLLEKLNAYKESLETLTIKEGEFIVIEK